MGGQLAQSGLLPPGVDGRRLQRLLSEFTLGTYAFDVPVRERDVREALRLAERMVQALRPGRPGRPGPGGQQ